MKNNLIQFILKKARKREMPIINVKLTTDYLQRIMKFSPVVALGELIWNALDADASLVRVEFTRNKLGGIEEIYVVDNGHGIFFENIESTFGNLGNSEKLLKPKTPKWGRGYHGRYGYGRYKALSLGSSVVWDSTYYDESQRKMYSFTIKCLRAEPTVFVVSERAESFRDDAGVKVIVAGVYERVSDKFNNLDGLLWGLIKQFADYILAYPGIELVIDDIKLEPNNFILEEIKKNITLTIEERTINASIRIIQWKESTISSRFYACSDKGISLLDLPLGIEHGNLSLSVYLMSDYIGELWKKGVLDLEDIDPGFRQLHEKAKEIVRDYYRDWLARSAAIAVQNLKKEGVYPYHGEPQDLLENAERQVFDICALKIHEMLPEFPKTNKAQKKLTLGLLKEALRQKPSELKRVLNEVLGLPDEQLKDLNEILNKTSLSAIISTIKMVSDRLKFLNGLEQLLYDKQYSKSILERSQLHKIIVSELWIFGEHYTYGCDDVKLYNVLREYVKFLGREELAKDMNPEEVKELNDIPDVCLWSQYGRGRPEEVENLIVELKRPKILIGQEEINQITSYAFKVSGNPRFPKEKTFWTFMLIGSALDETAKFIMRSEGRENGRYIKQGNICIYVKDWGEVLNEARARYKYLEEKLRLSVQDNSEGILFLQEKYAELIPQFAPKQVS